MARPRYTIPVPRRHFRAPVDTFKPALLRATKLTEHEIADTMGPLRLCATRLREGVATEQQYVVLRSAFRISESIERSGIVHGLGGHIATALAACDAIDARASASVGSWKQTALHWHELDAIDTMVDLHEFQLRQLSAGELQRIVQKLLAATRSSGGKVVTIAALEVSP